MIASWFSDVDACTIAAVAGRGGKSRVYPSPQWPVLCFSQTPQSFISYVRSVFLQKDKTVFDVNKLPLEEYALSLGLSKAPKIRFVKKQSKHFGAQDEDGSEQQPKKGKKQVAGAAEEENESEEDARVAGSGDESSEDEGEENGAQAGSDSEDEFLVRKGAPITADSADDDVCWLILSSVARPLCWVRVCCRLANWLAALY